MTCSVFSTPRMSSFFAVKQNGSASTFIGRNVKTVGVFHLRAMVFVKITFMLIGLAGAISFLMPGFPSRNNLKGKKILRL